MNTPTATLTASTAESRVADAIEAIGRVDAAMIDTLNGQDVLSFTAVLETLGRRVDALRVTSATSVHRRSDPVLGGESLSSLLCKQWCFG